MSILESTSSPAHQLMLDKLYLYVKLPSNIRHDSFTIIGT